MSETPETDAFFWRKDINWNKEVEFCCKLERERNEWKEVAEGSLLGAIHERDEAHERESQSINQVGKMLLRIEEMKCKHENECRKLQAGLGNIICDLQDTVADLRRELNTTKHLSDSWRDGYRAASNERDLWKSEAEHWRDISK